jgi:hypothetical protein
MARISTGAGKFNFGKWPHQWQIGCGNPGCISGYGPDATPVDRLLYQAILFAPYMANGIRQN